MEARKILRRVALLIAWMLAVGLIVVTWGPQSLRPGIGHPQIERFGAFFVTAAAFVLAYPRRTVAVAVIAVIFAVVLELGQFIAPGRDPGLSDAIAKAAGGICGALAMTAALRLLKSAPGQGKAA